MAFRIDGLRWTRTGRSGLDGVHGSPAAAGEQGGVDVRAALRGRARPGPPLAPLGTGEPGGGGTMHLCLRG